MAYPDAVIYKINDGFKIVRYEETEHYQVTRNFLNNTQKMLDIYSHVVPGMQEEVAQLIDSFLTNKKDVISKDPWKDPRA